MPELKIVKYGLAIFTNFGVSAWAGASTYGPVCFIRPKYRLDRGLLEHESVHTRQFWRTFGLHLVLRHFKGYKLRSEVEAYRVQATYYPDDRIPRFAELISTQYGLNITAKAAEILLRGAA